MNTYRTTDPGPVTIVAAAVAVFGDLIITQAQDAQSFPDARITQVDYQYRNIGPIEITSAFLGPSPLDVPAASGWALILFTILLLVAGTLIFRRLNTPIAA